MNQQDLDNVFSSLKINEHDQKQLLRLAKMDGCVSYEDVIEYVKDCHEIMRS